MSNLESKVYNLLQFRNFKDKMTFHAHYLTAMNYFKIDHPIRTGLTEDYTAAWIINYMAAHYHYIPYLPDGANSHTP